MWYKKTYSDDGRRAHEAFLCMLPKRYGSEEGCRYDNTAHFRTALVCRPWLCAYTVSCLNSMGEVQAAVEYYRVFQH